MISFSIQKPEGFLRGRYRSIPCWVKLDNEGGCEIRGRNVITDVLIHWNAIFDLRVLGVELPIYVEKID